MLQLLLFRGLLTTFFPVSYTHLKRMDNLVEHREESDRMQLLNGTWKFQYFNSIYAVSYTHLDVYKRQSQEEKKF